MNLKITEHFTFNEMVATSKGEWAEKNAAEALGYLQAFCRTLTQLEKARNFFQQPITITSGFRCPELNAAVGGSPTSQHTKGEAVDFTVSRFDDLKGLTVVFEWCRQHLDYRQLILETPEGKKPWIHFGISNGDGKKNAMMFNGKTYDAV